MKNRNDEVISYYKKVKHIEEYVFPQFGDTLGFIEQLLSTYLPSKYPNLFPTDSKWIEKLYDDMPNHLDLIDKKEKIKTTYETATKEIESKIKENLDENKYMLDILMQTGNDLEYSIKLFLENILEFKNITNPTLKKEDLSIILKNNTLFIIEVKGIKNTPSDNNCSQINKVRIRKLKEKKYEDVKALTIFNHQYLIDPSLRKILVFTPEQIQNAKEFESGLVTTSELFKVSKKIEQGEITKQQAREKLLGIRLITF